MKFAIKYGYGASGRFHLHAQKLLKFVLFAATSVLHWNRRLLAYLDEDERKNTCVATPESTFEKFYNIVEKVPPLPL